MISIAKQHFKKVILNKEDRLAKEDDLYKFSEILPWKASPSLPALMEWSESMRNQSENFFKNPAVAVHQDGDKLVFESPLPSLHEQNKWASADYFASRERNSAVIILGHWNANKPTYNELAKFYRRGGIAALRLSLPYHDERRPAQMPIATGLLSADLNQTIHGMQQAVVETRIAVDWLEKQGYKNIGIVAASLGTAVGFLAATHDPRIKAMVVYLSAAETGDLIWRSTATQHLRQSFGSDFSLEELRRAWSCITPAHYLPKLARPGFSIHVGWGKYDTVCPTDLTEKMLAELRALDINVSEAKYACGHNTLATAPFIHLAGLRGFRFMKKALG